MPELSNSFKAGKMNKDLDERLVSNGEYRDALNIEVSTSEGSNVGTAQTILGNRQVTSLLSKRWTGRVATGDINNPFKREDLVCKNYTVGYVVDEKVDRIIRFVATPAEENGGVGIDRIMEYNTDINVDQVEIPILVDIYQVKSRVSEVLAGSGNTFYIDLNAKYVRRGMKVKIEGIGGSATPFTWAEDIVVVGVEYENNVDPTVDYAYTAKITIEPRSSKDLPAKVIDVVAVGDTVFFKAPRVLNFDNLTSGTGGVTEKNTITGVNIIDDMLFWTDNYSEPKKINIPRCKLGTQAIPLYDSCSGVAPASSTTGICATSFIEIPAHEVHTTLVVKDINKPSQVFFPPGEAPIPHPLALNGSINPGYHHCGNGAVNEYGDIAIEEEHITVIRKSPTMPPTIETFKTLNVENTATGTELPAVTSTKAQLLFATLISNANVPWSTTAPSGDEFMFDEFPGFQSSSTVTSFDVGTMLKFSIRYTDSVGLYQSAELIATVRCNENSTAVVFQGTTLGTIAAGQYICTINSISKNHPVSPDSPTTANYFTYDVEVIANKPMFEVKFPRFAYRYKYSDGEYSCFGPFSNVAFVPSKFDYLPTKGYNLGMQNNLRYLEISDWVPKDIPKDVVQVDLLYKETSSPNVYTIESFKPNDEPCPTCNSINYWNQKGTKTTDFGAASSGIDKTQHKHSGAFVVNTDLIHATVPSNQLLRPWDNVPRKAIAQEMIGNRVVYANYLQNYNLIGGNNQNTIPKPEFDISLNKIKLDSTFAGLPGRSLKSMRNYQLGVVYRDEYGRETPVLTSQSGTTTVPKENAESYNKLNVGITTDHPSWAKSFKFFIKETSNEYYNLAMDRYYTAKDGNIWLSFPSSERNKVTEDSFLILKKEHNNNTAVPEKAKYKIIAIENNAPDFIKIEKQPWGSISPRPTFVDSGSPYTGKQNIEIELEQWNNSAFGGLVTQDIVGIQVKVRTTGGDYESLYYDVTNVGTVNYGTKSVKRLTVKNVFGEDMDFTSNDGGTTMIPNLVLEIRQKKVINKAQFDGRFFVKIQKDSVLEKRLQSAWGYVEANLIPLLSKKMSYLNYCGPGHRNGDNYNDWSGYRTDAHNGGNGSAGDTSNLNPTNAPVNGSGTGSFEYYSSWATSKVGGIDDQSKGDTNTAHTYSVPKGGADFTYTGLKGTADPRNVNQSTNNPQTWSLDKYYAAESQPMVTPTGSRWNNFRAQNSPGPGATYLAEDPTGGVYRSINEFIWKPGDAENGPWKGNGSSYTKGTTFGPTSWGSNFHGGSQLTTRNPVGGMLGEYCMPSNNDNGTATGECGIKSNGVDPVLVGTLIGYQGLGAFAKNITSTTDIYDPYTWAGGSGGATTPTGYNSGDTIITDTANVNAYHSELKDEVVGATGYYGRKYLRSQYVNGTNPTDITSYQTPYVYTSSQPGTSNSSSSFGEEGKEAYPPLDQGDKWVDWTCTQNPTCNPKFGDSTAVPPVAGYSTDPTATQFWVFASSIANTYNDRPAPNIELPKVYRDEQFPLSFPRKTNAHPKSTWFKDWWGGHGNFASIMKPSDVENTLAGISGGIREFEKSVKTTPSPRFDPSKRWFIDHLGAAQDKSGAGIFRNSVTTEVAMDISYIGIGDSTKDNTIWNMSETPTEMGFADAISTPGTRFRFKEDHNKTVYTITQSILSTDGDPGYIDPETGIAVASAVLRNENPEILNYQNDPENNDYSTASNRRIRWRLMIDKPISGEGEIGTSEPYYHPLINAVDYNLIDTTGTVANNPNFNPYGLTTGNPGEARGTASVVISADAYTNSKIITLAAGHNYNSTYEFATHNLSVGLTMIAGTGTITYSGSETNGSSIALHDQNDFSIKIEDIDHSVTPTVIYLSKPINASSGATLKFRVDPEEVKSYEFPMTPTAHSSGNGYTSRDFNTRNYWDSNFESHTSNDYKQRHYRYTHATLSFTAGSTTVAIATPSLSIAGQGNDRKILSGDTILCAGKTHRKAYVAKINNTSSFEMSHPAISTGSSQTGIFYRSGSTGLNEWGLNFQTMEILTSFDDSGNDSDLPMSPNPAIWETEPREDLGMDIYMEASQAYPINMDINVGEEYIKVGDLVQGTGVATDTYVKAVYGNIIILDTDLTSDLVVSDTVVFIENVYRGDGTIESKHYKNVTTGNSNAYSGGAFNTNKSGQDVLEVKKEVHKEKRTIKYFNCFSFQNGVESNRMRDDYNAVTIDKGVKASMPMATPYEEERRKSGFIFSGIYNSTSGINETNQFIQAEPITKDLNPAYGAIQKIFARDTDLVTFCEDKVFKVLANKDALFSAGGNTNLTATNRVLGATIPFSGEYGMSDRRSFAEQSFRMYFVDANRGAVLRLSKDGMTPISDYGMKDYFFDNLKDYTRVVGTFDDRKDIYNLTLDEAYSNDPKTISYTEDTRGWVSFKSFIPEGGCGFNNNYYTFSNGEIWRHHDETCATTSYITQDPLSGTSNNFPWFGATVPIIGQSDGSNILRLDNIPSEMFSMPGLVYNPAYVFQQHVPTIPIHSVNYSNFWAVSGRGINDSTYVKNIHVVTPDSDCVVKYDVELSKSADVENGTPVTFCAPRNNFYGRQYDSSVNILFNGGPEVVKAFSTIKYEGSQAMLKDKWTDPVNPQIPVDQYDYHKNFQSINCHSNTDYAPWDSINQNGEYFNNINKFGWYVNSVTTDQQHGKVRDFKNKEGKWFNYIIGEKRNDDLKKERLNTSEFSLQGIGTHDCVTEFDLDLYPLEVGLDLPINKDHSVQVEANNFVTNNIDFKYHTYPSTSLELNGTGKNTKIRLLENTSVSTHFSEHPEFQYHLPSGDEGVLTPLTVTYIKFIIDPLPAHFINALSYGVLGGELIEGGQPGDGYSVWRGDQNGSISFGYSDWDFGTTAYNCNTNPATCKAPFKIEFRDTTTGWEADNNVEVTVYIKPGFLKSPALDNIKPIIVGDATKLGNRSSWSGISGI